MKSKGFVENTLLFLILGISALALPAITKALPTYTSQIAQNFNKETITRIAEGEIDYVQAGQKCTVRVCDPNSNLVCGGANPVDDMICVVRGTVKDGDRCNGVDAACKSGWCGGQNSSYYDICVPKGGVENGDLCAGRDASCKSNWCGGRDSNGYATCTTKGALENGDRCGAKNESCKSKWCGGRDSKGEYICAKHPNDLAEPGPETPKPPAAVPLPNPPTGTKAVAYCENGKINADITFTPSGNAASHKVSYNFANNPPTTKYTPVNNAYTVDNISKNFKFNYTSYACNSAGNCIEDQKGYYFINVGDPCSTAGGTGGAAAQGTLKTIVKVIPNGIEYKKVWVFWNPPDNIDLTDEQPYNSLNTYTFSGPSKVGTHEHSVLVDNGSTMMELEDEYTVTEGNTTTKNVTITLDGTSFSGGNSGGSNSGNGNTGGNTGVPGLGGVNETGVCAGKGGIDTSFVGYSTTSPGYMGPRCSSPASEDGKFDAVKASDKAFCGKTYADAWKCKNGTTAYDTYPASTACTTSIAWCPTSTGNTGGGNGGTGGNTGTNPGGGAPKQGTFNAVVRVVTNGASYGNVGIVWRGPDNTIEETTQAHKNSNVYTFSVPAKVGTFDASAYVNNTSGQLIKDSAETCRNTGGTGPHDCKITVSEGATTTQNFTMSLDPQQTAPGGTTPIPNPNTGSPGAGAKTGIGEACTASGTLCGGGNSNSCLPARDGPSLHCCRFTDTFCEGLNRCLGPGTIELQNCEKIHNTPTPTKIGAFDASTCNGAPGSTVNHCTSKNASGKTLTCCPGYSCNGTYCAKNSASMNSSQSVASESECSKNSDCKKINKNACVLNFQEVGTCK